LVQFQTFGIHLRYHVQYTIRSFILPCGNKAGTLLPKNSIAEVLQDATQAPQPIQVAASKLYQHRV
jgi:hypothetical protein